MFYVQAGDENSLRGGATPLHRKTCHHQHADDKQVTCARLRASLREQRVFYHNSDMKVASPWDPNSNKLKAIEAAKGCQKPWKYLQLGPRTSIFGSWYPCPRYHCQSVGGTLISTTLCPSKRKESLQSEPRHGSTFNVAVTTHCQGRNDSSQTVRHHITHHERELKPCIHSGTSTTACCSTPVSLALAPLSSWASVALSGSHGGQEADLRALVILMLKNARNLSSGNPDNLRRLVSINNFGAVLALAPLWRSWFRRQPGIAGSFHGKVSNPSLNAT